MPRCYPLPTPSKETHRIWAIPTSGLSRGWGGPDPWTPRPAPPLDFQHLILIQLLIFIYFNKKQYQLDTTMMSLYVILVLMFLQTLGA